MATLLEVTKQADTLSIEEKAGLVSHILDSLPGAPLGPDDEEVMIRTRMTVLKWMAVLKWMPCSRRLMASAARLRRRRDVILGGRGFLAEFVSAEAA